MTIDLVPWLMDGDPAIRWRTMRDLLHAPQEAWQAERRRTLREGWGARYLALQAPDYSWGAGIYSPKWISTTYTLLDLRAIGIPGEHVPARRGVELILDKEFGPLGAGAFADRLAKCDRCIVGMDLQLAAHFDLQDARREALVENLLAARMPDGAWNCRHTRKPAPHHSSFHTTFSVLEGLRDWLDVTPSHPLRADVLAAEARALEFMLEHRLYRSDKTGAVIDPRFDRLPFPHYWHYTVLRGLEYFARVGAARDERLSEAISLLEAHRRVDGTWPVQYKFSGLLHFQMEKQGAPSRWNTLRALRVLRWWRS